MTSVSQGSDEGQDSSATTVSSVPLPMHNLLFVDGKLSGWNGRWRLGSRYISQFFSSLPEVRIYGRLLEPLIY